MSPILNLNGGPALKHCQIQISQSLGSCGLQCEASMDWICFVVVCSIISDSYLASPALLIRRWFKHCTWLVYLHARMFSDLEGACMCKTSRSGQRRSSSSAPTGCCSTAPSASRRSCEHRGTPRSSTWSNSDRAHPHLEERHQRDEVRKKMREVNEEQRA